MKTVRLDANTIVDRDSFHGTFKEPFGFPDWYGANMDAWIECMSDLDDVESGMTEIKLDSEEMLCLEVTGVESLAERIPDVLEDSVVCTALVNQEYME
ncbi:MAG: barstar family protein [Rubrobacteraceae bacterium]